MELFSRHLFSYSSEGVCTKDYCKNGGNCRVTESGKAECDCTDGFVGDQCDQGKVLFDFLFL